MQVYLDSAATTKPYQEVVDVMVDVMQNHWYNPSSVYADDSRQIIENVREQIAQDINADPSEIVFTSGACEANTLAYKLKTWNFISSRLEHKSIDCLNKYYHASLINNDNYGLISCNHLIGQLKTKSPYRSLVSIQAANSEIGTIQDLKTISNIVHENNGVFHTDATQLYPEQRIDVKEYDIDLMSVSAQKFHASKGVGFLYIKKGLTLDPIIFGAQEDGIRAGTYDTANIAGMGKALKLTRAHNASGAVQRLRDKLLDKLLRVNRVILNGPPVGSQRLKNNISLIIDGVDAEKLVTMCSLYGIYFSRGSACNSYNPKPSKTLKAIGLTNEQAFNTIRLTLDEFNTEEEINYAADIIIKFIERIRNDD